MAGIAQISHDFLKAGGKRLRPRLCAAVFAAVNPKGAETCPSEILEAIECFHKASLIHDDIQDGDEMRYGRPSVWRAYGIPVAIAVGDWLVAYGYRLIAESASPAVPSLLAACARSHLRLCEGQGDELLGVSDYLSVCERKTGEGFALAAELGALAAGADPKPYRAWGLLYGTIFQIRDDLADRGETPELRRLELECVRRLDGMGMVPFL